jgi:hypothetical protein
MGIKEIKDTKDIKDYQVAAVLSLDLPTISNLPCFRSIGLQYFRSAYPLCRYAFIHFYVPYTCMPVRGVAGYREGLLIAKK